MSSDDIYAKTRMKQEEMIMERIEKRTIPRTLDVSYACGLVKSYNGEVWWSNQTVMVKVENGDQSTSRLENEKLSE